MKSVKLSTGRYDRPSSYQTQVCGDANEGCCIYRGTKIVEWDREKIKLNTGGWASVTTKRKMNQVSNMFNLGVQVYAFKGEWFVNKPLDPEGYPQEYGVTCAQGRTHYLAR